MQTRPLFAFSLVFSGMAVFHALCFFFFGVSFQNTFFFPAYAGNYAIGCLLLWGLLRALKHNSHLVGWLYLLASSAKFGLFFLLFWPLLKADGEITWLEKTTFLIPYFVALILETYFLVQKLNKL